MKLYLNITDMDETLVKNVKANVLVKKNNKIIKKLSNTEYNEYKLQEDESFDYREFASSEVFVKNAEKIEEVLEYFKRKINLPLKKNETKRNLILTARSDFDNKEVFLDFLEQKLGLENCGKEEKDTNKVYIARIGNTDFKKGSDFGKLIYMKQYIYRILIKNRKDILNKKIEENEKIDEIYINFFEDNSKNLEILKEIIDIFDLPFTYKQYLIKNGKFYQKSYIENSLKLQINGINQNEKQYKILKEELRFYIEELNKIEELINKLTKEKIMDLKLKMIIEAKHNLDIKNYEDLIKQSNGYIYFDFSKDLKKLGIDESNYFLLLENNLDFIENKVTKDKDKYNIEISFKAEDYDKINNLVLKEKKEIEELLDYIIPEIEAMPKKNKNNKRYMF